MWQYISAIFNDTSDQARLLTVLITTGITIGVVFINNNLQRNRNRKELLTSKVEELYLASNRYTIAANSLLFQAEKNKGTHYSGATPIDKELSDAVVTELNNIDMLINLYFKSNSIPLDSFELDNFPIFAVVSASSITKTKDQIVANKQKLEDLCKVLEK